jgi:hypothetical protein
MKPATVSFCFRLSGPGVEAAAEQLLDTLSPRLVQPRSMDLQLVSLSGLRPALATRYKFPGSVDGEAFWPAPWGPSLLPGERPAAGGYTELAEGGDWLTLPRDHDLVLERVRAFREMAARYESSKAARRAWAVWTFWGLTRVFHALSAGGLGEGWLFREFLEHHNSLVPILRVICQIGADPKAPFDWRAQTYGHSWSFFSSRYDRGTRRWARKEEVAAPEQNARLLVQALAAWLLKFPNACFSWDLEREHRPDLSGCVPQVIRQLFGPRRARLEVAAIPALSRKWNGRIE